MSDIENKKAGQYAPASGSALSASKVVQRKSVDRRAVETTASNNREPGSREIVARRAAEMSAKQAEAAAAAEARREETEEALNAARVHEEALATELTRAERTHAALWRRVRAGDLDGSVGALTLAHEELAAAENEIADLRRRHREAELTVEVLTIAAADAAATAAATRAAMLKTTPTPEERFAAEVRSGRERLNLTQPQLAQKLLELYGIDLGATGIARIESGQRSVRLNEVVALTELLRLSLKTYAPSTSLKSAAEYEDARRRLHALTDRHNAVLTRMASISMELDLLENEADTVYQQITQVTEEIEDYRRIHEGVV